MAYLTQREVEKLKDVVPDGTHDKPFFKKVPDWGCVAEYMGFTLKWDESPVDEWKPTGREVKYYCYPKYKMSYDSFEFRDWDVDHIFMVYKQLQDDGFYDDELKSAWSSLDKKLMLETLYKKVNEILISKKESNGAV